MPSTQRSENTANFPRFLTLVDVQDVLNVSERTAYSLVRSGEIPAIQVGAKRVWRIEQDDFERYLDERRAAAKERTSGAAAS